MINLNNEMINLVYLKSKLIPKDIPGFSIWYNLIKSPKTDISECNGMFEWTIYFTNWSKNIKLIIKTKYLDFITI